MTEDVHNTNSSSPVMPGNNNNYAPTVARMRGKLYALAKAKPTYRFYSLYGHVLRGDVLQAAWDQVAAHNGAPGVDGVTIDKIVHSPGGVSGFLESIHESLRTRTYRPAAVKRAYIAKANGKLRPLGIPTIRDRVVQTAVKIVIEPIFEADFLECSHGFRPARSAHQALRAVWKHIRDGKQTLYDADLRSYFDTIPHDKLLLCVQKRITDGSILGLLRAWLTAIIEERHDDDDPPKRTRPTQGTPQGGVISPVLANIYLHWFDKLFHATTGPWHWANARLVRYADDFIIHARYMSERLVTWIQDTITTRFGLQLNDEKTTIRRVAPDTTEGVNFLGMRIWHAPGYLYAGRYLTAQPSPAAMCTMRTTISTLCDRRSYGTPIHDLIQRINKSTAGWAVYHDKGRPAKQYWQINTHTLLTLIRHLKRRSQRPYRKPIGTTWWNHLKQLGWQPLTTAR